MHLCRGASGLPGPGMVRILSAEAVSEEDAGISWAIYCCLLCSFPSDSRCSRAESPGFVVASSASAPAGRQRVLPAYCLQSPPAPGRLSHSHESLGSRRGGPGWAASTSMDTALPGQQGQVREPLCKGLNGATCKGQDRVKMPQGANDPPALCRALGILAWLSRPGDVLGLF